jgi:hypothetical protein
MADRECTRCPGWGHRVDVSAVGGVLVTDGVSNVRQFCCVFLDGSDITICPSTHAPRAELSTHAAAYDRSQQQERGQEQETGEGGPAAGGCHQGRQGHAEGALPATSVRAALGHAVITSTPARQARMACPPRTYS